MIDTLLAHVCIAGVPQDKPNILSSGAETGVEKLISKRVKKRRRPNETKRIVF
jgi:hypothetical protein